MNDGADGRSAFIAAAVAEDIFKQAGRLGGLDSRQLFAKGRQLIDAIEASTGWENGYLLAVKLAAVGAVLAGAAGVVADEDGGLISDESESDAS